MYFLRLFGRRNPPSVNYFSTENADLWVIRVNRDHKLASSAPCISCLAALKKYGIRRVYFSNSDGSIQKMYVDEIPQFVTRRQKLEGIHVHWNLTKYK